MDCNYLNDIEGLQFMPVLKNKRPIKQKWEQTKIKYDLTNCEYVGLVCGEISGNLEVIDIDAKYDLTGQLFSSFKKEINNIDKGILKKLVVQKTVGGGYHFIYRCDVIEGNKKLAQRPTTKQEKDQTYTKQLEHFKNTKQKDGQSDDDFLLECEKEALKSANNDKVRVLLETRGDRGYIACFPSEGYELLYGDYKKISKITPEERDVIFNVAYSFNEVLKEPVHDRKLERKNIKGLTPSEDYNQRGDVIGLLEKNGWTRVGRKGSKILMKRPGDTKADHSGNFDEDKNWFSVFTTSTLFESQTPYLPYAVYCMLECGGDYSTVSKKLYDEGFGDRYDTISSNMIDVPVNIDLDRTDITDFIAQAKDYDNYLHKWRTNTFEKGLSTGSKILDKYFLFKEGDLVMVNGVDNVGKSSLIWFLSFVSAALHGWKWLIYSSENKVGGVMRKLIEFYCGEPIESINDIKFKKAKAFVEEHFDIIKSTDELYNYMDIMSMVRIALKKKNYKGLMIDPYNSLKIDKPKGANQNTYEYHYEAASKLKLFGMQNNISIYLNAHVGTNAARNKDTEGHTLAPQKEDTEMGVMFANKADEFITIHRQTQHKTNWGFNEFHVRKVKELETGGAVTPLHSPIIFSPISGLVGFFIMTEKSFEKKAIRENPLYEWRKQFKEKNQTDIFKDPIIDYDTNEFITPEQDEDIPF